MASLGYRSLEEAIVDLEKHGHLCRIREEIDPCLQAPSVHRRVHQAGGPAIYFERLKGSSFPAVSNLFGTMERARFLLRHSLQGAKALVKLKAKPPAFFQKPWSYRRAPLALLHSLPLPSLSAPVLRCSTSINKLPLIQSWPKDGGPFITLPQVYTENPAKKASVFHSNLGMYRIQMQGNLYKTNKQVGLHYQIQRGIGVHHAQAIEKGLPLFASIFVGGNPAHMLAAVMPLPENIPELLFAGILANRNFRYKRLGPYLASSEADFCIMGRVEKHLLPEGPFGDHLGYYAMRHDFPVLRIEAVYHRPGAIWPFTVVGRPPQEDSIFGSLIQELCAPMIPASIPGLKTMHAVDAAGVHPLMLAIGRESHRPYDRKRPSELLSLANAILGFGQASLAKYLFIVAGEDNPELDARNIEKFFVHLLERADWKRDLHFQTCTSMDTLDYTGTALHEGSRLVIAAAGRKIRSLAFHPPSSLVCPASFHSPLIAMPGILALSGPVFTSYAQAAKEMQSLAAHLKKKLNSGLMQRLPLIVIADESGFAAKNINNFLWICFTRSDPARDIYGVDSYFQDKHWSCKGPLIIDARIKGHHAPPLAEDPRVEKSVDALGAKGASLHGII